MVLGGVEVEATEVGLRSARGGEAQERLAVDSVGSLGNGGRWGKNEEVEVDLRLPSAPSLRNSQAGDAPSHGYARSLAYPFPASEVDQRR